MIHLRIDARIVTVEARVPSAGGLLHRASRMCVASYLAEKMLLRGAFPAITVAWWFLGGALSPFRKNATRASEIK